jgi:hypothetical protein
MTRFAHIIPALIISAGLTACARVPEAGIADPDQFRASASGPVVASKRPAAKVAACFEARALLLPMSSFTNDPRTGGKIYRLRGYGRTYEEILFVPATKGGSTATVLIAANLSPKWQQDFARDRGVMLEACASGAAQ